MWWTFLACAPDPAPPPGPRVVVLVSFDTTRADALGAYARPEVLPAPRTVYADHLAAQGLRFARAFTNAPTTLSAHSALMTGLDSHGHGVPRNGFALEPGAPTLAERLAAAGFDTLAVVGAVPLQAEMGLGRGFGVYDDLGLEGAQAAVGADVVRRAALEHVARRPDPGRDLFLFVHFYDPHTPWVTAPPEIVRHFVDPAYAGALDGGQASVDALVEARRAGPLPPEEARQARALYHAQVAFADMNLGALLDGLAAQGLMDDALVVLTSDHGETLDEDGEQPYGHGADLDPVDLHIPLILYGTGRMALPAGQVVEAPVRLQDLGPTVLGLVGLAPRLGEGVDLSPLWRGQPLDLPPLKVEATQPASREAVDGWNNLPFARGVADEGALYVLGPAWEGRPASLIDLHTGQARADEALAARLAAELAAWDAAAPPHREPGADPATLEALRQLGYLD